MMMGKWGIGGDGKEAKVFKALIALPTGIYRMNGGT